MSANNKQKVVYPLDSLLFEIDKIIGKKIFQDSLWRDINEEFERKGLDKKSLQLLLDNSKKTASSLTDYELIAFSKVAYNKLKNEKFNPKNYFGETVLITYENNILNNNEEKIERIKLENFRKIDDFNYRGQITYKELYDYFNNNLIIYDHNAQRSPKYREIGSKNGRSKKLKVVNLNMDTVESIAEAIVEGVFEDTEIILNCELLEGKEQKFNFDAKYNNILGDIVIEPDYDMDSNSTTWVTIPDGYHRCMGIVLAMNRYYSKENMWLEGSIGVRLVRATKERAKRIVYQTFLRSQDELEWVNALAENDYTKFVDMIVQNSKRLTIENTIEEAETNNKLTGKSILVDIIKTTDIAVNDLSKAFFNAKAIANNFDLVYDYITSENFKINPQIIAGYIYICHIVRGNTALLLDCIEKISSNDKFKSLARKNLNVDNFLTMIDEIIEEVTTNG